jgi:hypothetical protein
MGKITVKHYLEKRVKNLESVQFDPKYNANEDNDKNPFIYFDPPRVVYPIYLQVTINRKTTKLRSFTKHELTENEFNTYQETGYYQYDFLFPTLSKEIEISTRIFEYFVNLKKFDPSKHGIKEILQFYQRNIKEDFYQSAYFDTLRAAFDRSEILKPLSNFIYYKVNPKELSEYFKRVFAYDFKKHLTEKETMILEAIGYFDDSTIELKKELKRLLLIDWYNGKANDNFKRFMVKKKLSVKERDQYHYIINEIAEMQEQLFLIGDDFK